MIKDGNLIFRDIFGRTGEKENKVLVVDEINSNVRKGQCHKAPFFLKVLGKNTGWTSVGGKFKLNKEKYSGMWVEIRIMLAKGDCCD